MGAQYDETTIPNDVTREQLSMAFTKIVDQRAWESGHGGYTGTFAECRGLKVHDKTFPDTKTAMAYIDGDWDESTKAFTEGAAQKWGPAIAVRIESPKFTGWYIGAICSS